MLIRAAAESDFSSMLAIINDAARAYRGVIPEDRWHEPYMPTEELKSEIADDIVFWVAVEDDRVLGVMGMQEKGDVALVRHAYVAPNTQRSGVGTRLLRHVQALTEKPVLIGTWATASWAIEFYQRNGFCIVSATEKDRLLRTYWSIPVRQIETSVVLASENWMQRDRIPRGDSRYHAVIDKRFNKRFLARPDCVRLVSSTEDVVSAVNDAVREGCRLVVTSGGHCLEGFVSDPDVRVIIDVSPMKRVYYDPAMNAVAVESGATVGETFRALADAWGVVIPLGEHPGIGMGGHVPGGAFGFLCRQLGLAADYLHAVEVVVVDEDGHARSVIASCEPNDVNHDLWWAHTGAGAGNFGVVTRFWFRSAGTSGVDPALLLPSAPQSITTFKAEWNWSDIDETSFRRLLRNHGDWCEQHCHVDTPSASLWALLELHRRQFGTIVVRGVSTAGNAAEALWDEHLTALSKGVSAPTARVSARMSWLAFALDPLPDLFAAPPGGVSVKVKDALLRKAFTDTQIGVAYDYLTNADYNVMGGMLGFATYGGRINTVAPHATASAQRNSILDMACTTGWIDASDERQNMEWARSFYRDLFADTGGVPVPGDAYDGAFINHPDVDLVDETLNTSGVPWHTIYFRDNYPRLQRIKARWDPGDVFRHALSIRPA